SQQRRQQHRPLEIKADIVLVGESDRAMKLDAGLGDEKSVFGSLGFRRDCHCGIDVKDLVVGGDLKRERSDSFDADIDIDRLMLQRLEAADEFSELLANAQVI